MTARPIITVTSVLIESIREEFGTEYNQVMASLSAAATRYAERDVPAMVAALPEHMQAYLNYSATVGFRYQGFASNEIRLTDTAGAFPEVAQIPLLRPVVCPRYPAVLVLDLQTAAGVALDAAFAAMEELLDRVSRRSAEFATIII